MVGRSTGLTLLVKLIGSFSLINATSQSYLGPTCGSYLGCTMILSIGIICSVPSTVRRSCSPVHSLTIVNRRDWLGSPANIKGTNKNAKIYVGRSTTLHNLLFRSHTLYMSYVTDTILLVSSSVRSKQLLCFVQGRGQKTEQKHTTKNLDGFHNHSPLLTMV